MPENDRPTSGNEQDEIKELEELHDKISMKRLSLRLRERTKLTINATGSPEIMFVNKWFKQYTDLNYTNS